ncbi:MAG: hydrogenase expression/formation protein HypE [Candidatus Sumerlaeota bacterium]|nr:hydrogenase expression/formation protein HypE [Candidatus Sumerlaeota bacterium]
MDNSKILLAHGGGGALMRELIEQTIGPAIGGLTQDLPDAAPIPGEFDGLALTTDSFVVKPLFFQGGDIGCLSVYGTLNDLAVSGARPLALSMALILEEGLEIEILKRVLESAGRAARECGVPIITGDTKVVSRGQADQLYITTAGVGQRRAALSPALIREGDAILINGGIAEHGVAVMSARQGLEFETPIRSDAAPVWPLVRALLDQGVMVKVMRDPTRGGLAACCYEIAESAGVTVVLEEERIPLRQEVIGACGMLGLDPLNIANEGKVVVFVSPADAERAVDILRELPTGKDAAIIGHAVSRRAKPAILRTRYGAERVIEMPYGEDLPRIC